MRTQEQRQQQRQETIDALAIDLVASLGQGLRSLRVDAWDWEDLAEVAQQAGIDGTRWMAETTTLVEQALAQARRSLRREAGHEWWEQYQEPKKGDLVEFEGRVRPYADQPIEGRLPLTPEHWIDLNETTTAKVTSARGDGITLRFPDGLDWRFGKGSVRMDVIGKAR